MNPATSAPVIQSDRDAASSLLMANGASRVGWKTQGMHSDDYFVIQAFAAYRVQIEHRTRLALGEGEKEERQPVDFEAEGKKVNDLYWRETPAYIAMMGVVRGYVLGQASLAAGASEEAVEPVVCACGGGYVGSCEMCDEPAAGASVRVDGMSPKALSLRLADCRQALHDAEDNAALVQEARRAFSLMGDAQDMIKALAALSAPSEVGEGSK